MKSKLNAFRYSDRTFEVEYKLGWFESTDDIDTQSSIDDIMQMKVDIDDKREVFEDAKIFIDSKKKFRVFVKVKEDIDIAFDAESAQILVGVRIKWKK